MVGNRYQGWYQTHDRLLMVAAIAREQIIGAVVGMERD